MIFLRVFACLCLVCASGCGGFAARRILQAPNTYPKWLAPKAPVALEFSEKLLTAFPDHYVQIEAPAARLRYKVIDPADYSFRWTNRVSASGREMVLSFGAMVLEHARTNEWTAAPRGTVVLVHGYGVGGFAMLPWTFVLAQEGWRCVLVDLRGHGRSTGKQVYFGVQEVEDLKALLDELGAGAPRPVCVAGHSFGAVLALRWKQMDARIGNVVAMAPYADLSRAILNVSHEYAGWMPDWILRAGLRQLPSRLHVSDCALNPACWLEPMEALFIAGEADRIVPLEDVKLLADRAGCGSRLLVVPGAAHEPLPFYLDALDEPVRQWLAHE